MMLVVRWDDIDVRYDNSTWVQKNMALNGREKDYDHLNVTTHTIQEGKP